MIILKRLLLYGITLPIFFAIFAFTYWLGDGQGYADGHYDGYVQGESIGLSILSQSENVALARGYEAGLREGLKATTEEAYYRGIYATCLNVHEIFLNTEQWRRVMSCQAGVGYAYRQNWFETFDEDSFIWPLPEIFK